MNDSEVNDVEMGPGMDLVVSILAFVILVLAILALERKMNNAESEALPAPPKIIQEPDTRNKVPFEIDKLNALIASNSAKLEQASTALLLAEDKLKSFEALLAEKDKQLVQAIEELVEKDKANSLLMDDLTQTQKHTEALKEQLGDQNAFSAASLADREKKNADEILRLGDELTNALALLAATNKKSQEKSLRLDEFVSKMTEVEDEKAQLSDQLRKARQQNQKLSKASGAKVQSLSQQIQSLEGLLKEAEAQLRENRRRMRVELRDRGDLEIFDQGKATLTARGRVQLYGRLIPSLRSAVATGQPNVLRVAGHASPERMARGIRVGFDNNLQLSAERSLTIAYELASLGVSLRCISVEGHGRSRSPALKLVSPDLGLKEFDAHYDAQNAATKRQFLQRVAQERRVVVLVTREADGQCSPSLLKFGIENANVEARKRLNNR